MATTRSYNESCALAHSLDLVGERWALLVARELMFGPRRFTDLLTRLPGASTSVLTDRLQRMTEAGVVTRRRLPPPAASWVYELTEWGRDLQPAMLALAQWGRRSPGRRSDLSSTPAAVAMSLLAHFDPSSAEGLEAEVDLHLDGDRFRAVLGDGELRIGPPQAAPAPAVVRVDAEHLKALLGAAGAGPEQLAAAGIEVEGDVDAVRRLLGTLTG